MDRQRRERLQQAIAPSGQTPGDAAWARSVCEACVAILDDVPFTLLAAGG